MVKGIHGDNLPPKVYADKGYCGEPNRVFLGMNGIGDGIMRKDQINAKLGSMEIECNRMISKVRYKIEQHFGLSHLHQMGGRARFTTLAKEGWDRLCGGHGLQPQASSPGIGEKTDTCQGMRGVVRPRTEKGKKVQIVPSWEHLDVV
ncbi:MAG: transposase [Deltaproteobacteria bacterium]|nr:transposase [Deltaproteobacteria bacterium]